MQGDGTTPGNPCVVVSDAESENESEEAPSLLQVDKSTGSQHCPLVQKFDLFLHRFSFL